jgi:hypothetical protein
MSRPRLYHKESFREILSHIQGIPEAPTDSPEWGEFLDTVSEIHSDATPVREFRNHVMLLLSDTFQFEDDEVSLHVEEVAMQMTYLHGIYLQEAILERQHMLRLEKERKERALASILAMESRIANEIMVCHILPLL